VKFEPIDNAGDMAALVDISSLLLLSQDSSEAGNAKGSTNSNANEMDENESSSESSEDALPSPSQLIELTRERIIRKKRQRKDYTKILPPSLVSLCPKR
jgi:hypothetical protein